MQITPVRTGAPVSEKTQPPVDPQKASEEELNQIFREMSQEMSQSRKLREQYLEQARLEAEKAKLEAGMRTAITQNAMNALWWAQFKPAQAAAPPPPPPPPPPPAPAKK